MSFTPYQIQKPELPKLEIGYFVKIGESFYQVTQRKIWRRKLANISSPTKFVDPTYAGITGNLDLKRLVHYRYLSVDADVGALFYWGETKPLFSDYADITVDTKTAGLSNPIQIDKWSYSNSMYIYLKSLTGTVNVYLEGFEYAIEKSEEKPAKYLDIAPNGDARFVGE